MLLRVATLPLLALGLLIGVAHAEPFQPVVPMCGVPPGPCTASNPLPTTGAGGTVTAVPTTGTGGQNSVSVTNSSGSILAARTAPKYALSVKNESTTASIAFCFGASCTAALNTAGSITIPPGFMWSDSPAFIHLDQINGISSGTTSPATITAN